MTPTRSAKPNIIWLFIFAVFTAAAQANHAFEEPRRGDAFASSYERKSESFVSETDQIEFPVENSEFLGVRVFGSGTWGSQHSITVYCSSGNDCFKVVARSNGEKDAVAEVSSSPIQTEEVTRTISKFSELGLWSSPKVLIESFGGRDGAIMVIEISKGGLKHSTVASIGRCASPVALVEQAIQLLDRSGAMRLCEKK